MDKTNYENVEFRRSILFDLGLYDDESIIICRRNKTRRALNKRIREKIYSYKRVLELGERIMILRNRRESGLRNGSIVTIKAIHEVDFRSSIASITVEEVNGEKIRLDVFLHTILGEELPKITQDQKNIVDIDYAYAITCHKSQGSEFKKVFVIREDSHFEDWDKWYYTAVTRAREKLYIY